MICFTRTVWNGFGSSLLPNFHSPPLIRTSWVRRPSTQCAAVATKFRSMIAPPENQCKIILVISHFTFSHLFHIVSMNTIELDMYRIELFWSILSRSLLAWKSLWENIPCVNHLNGFCFVLCVISDACSTHHGNSPKAASFGAFPRGNPSCANKNDSVLSE